MIRTSSTPGFSSGLWPFAIFGWPERTPELERFYPTDALVTGRDIIFLWVARMIMTGIKFTGRNPFTDVLITSTIQATDGSRMSKSKGNTIDPLDLIDKYGADALRAWAAAVGTSGQDMRFDDDRIASYQRFANKLWQVTNGFLVAKVGGGAVSELDIHPPRPETLRPEDRWMLAEVAAVVRECDAGFAAFRFHEAVDRLYDTAWHSLCDWYIEMVKLRLTETSDPDSRRAAVWTAVTSLDVLLRLLHPFMPFVTEECAQQLPNAAPTLQQRQWPEVEALWADDTTTAAHAEIAEAIDLVQRIRALGHEHRVPRGARDRVQIVIRADDGRGPAKRLTALIGGLVPATVLGAHARGVDPTVVVSGRLHAEVVIADTAADGSATRRQDRHPRSNRDAARVTTRESGIHRRSARARRRRGASPAGRGDCTDGSAAPHPDRRTHRWRLTWGPCWSPGSSSWSSTWRCSGSRSPFTSSAMRAGGRRRPGSPSSRCSSASSRPFLAP